MKVIEMGNLGLADGMVGLLIEATRQELQEMENLLYEDVCVVAADKRQQADNNKAGRSHGTRKST